MLFRSVRSVLNMRFITILALLKAASLVCAQAKRDQLVLSDAGLECVNGDTLYKRAQLVISDASFECGNGGSLACCSYFGSRTSICYGRSHMMPLKFDF